MLKRLKEEVLFLKTVLSLPFVVGIILTDTAKELLVKWSTRPAPVRNLGVLSKREFLRYYKRHCREIL